jgi:hypothetical protein
MAVKPIPEGYGRVTPYLTIRYIATQMKDNAG